MIIFNFKIKQEIIFIRYLGTCMHKEPFIQTEGNTLYIFNKVASIDI